MAADLPTAAEIRAAAEAAAGPVPANYRETIVATGSLGETKTVTFRSGKDVRRTFDRGGLHDESGTYQGERWQQGYNGLTVAIPPDPGNEIKEALTTTVSRVTKPFDALVVTELNVRGSGTRRFYDPVSFRPIRVETFGTTGTVLESFDEFAIFGNRTLPKRWTISSSDSHLEMHYARKEFVAGGATDDDVKESSTRRVLVEFPAGVNFADLPVHLAGHAIYVRVTIGSRSADFELDTGASTMFVDTAFAKELGLHLINARSAVTAQRYTAYNASIPELRVGSLRMSDIAVTVGPMPIVHPDGTKPVGLLGFDFLAQLGVSIDYQRARVRVVPAANFTPPADPSTYAFDVRLASGQPMVSASVANAVADHVLFDTGWSGQLAFFDYFTRRYPDAFKDDLGAANFYGIGGGFTAEVFRFRDFTLGHIHFQQFTGLRIPPSSYAGSADGLIGNDLLSLFNVDLDYTDGRVYLTPNDNGRRTMHTLTPAK